MSLADSELNEMRADLARLAAYLDGGFIVCEADSDTPRIEIQPPYPPELEGFDDEVIYSWVEDHMRPFATAADPEAADHITTAFAAFPSLVARYGALLDFVERLLDSAPPGAREELDAILNASMMSLGDLDTPPSGD